MIPLPSTWIESLFNRFEGMYGKSFHAKWDGMNIENVKKVWAEDLGEFNSETLKAALQACRETCEHPPSSAKFYQLCKAVRKPAEQLTYALPHHKQYSPEVAKENLQRMKEMLEKSNIGGANEPIDQE